MREITALFAALLITITSASAQEFPTFGNAAKRLEARVAKLENRVKELEGWRANAEDEIKVLTHHIWQIESAVKDGFFKIKSFAAGSSLGFDIQAGPHQEKACPVSQFITGVTTYVEDGHVKMVFACSELTPATMPW